MQAVQWMRIGLVCCLYRVHAQHGGLAGAPP